MPSVVAGIWVHGAWHEAVIDSSDRLPASMTSLGGAAVIQPRGQRFTPQIESRMSAARSFELTVSTRSGPRRRRNRRPEAVAQRSAQPHLRASAAALRTPQRRLEKRCLLIGYPFPALARLKCGLAALPSANGRFKLRGYTPYQAVGKRTQRGQAFAQRSQPLLLLPTTQVLPLERAFATARSGSSSSS